jgi:hypothetical protein
MAGLLHCEADAFSAGFGLSRFARQSLLSLSLRVGGAHEFPAQGRSRAPFQPRWDSCRVDRSAAWCGCLRWGFAGQSGPAGKWKVMPTVADSSAWTEASVLEWLPIGAGTGRRRNLADVVGGSRRWSSFRLLDILGRFDGTTPNQFRVRRFGKVEEAFVLRIALSRG